MKIFLQFGLFILLAHSMSVFSSEPFPVDSSELEKLFEPVDPSLQDQLFKENQFSLKRATYFGKRYRIVKVNLDLLAPNGKAFVVNPFDDVEFIVKTKQIRTHGNGIWQSWIAERLDRRIDLDLPDVPQDVIDSYNSLSLDIRSYRHEAVVEYDPSGNGLNAFGPDPDKVEIRSKLYISGILTDFGNQYRVVPTDSTAEYYLVVEIDPHKQLIRGNSEDAKARRGAHMAFDKALREAEAQSKQQRFTTEGDLK